MLSWADRVAAVPRRIAPASIRRDSVRSVANAPFRCSADRGIGLGAVPHGQEPKFDNATGQFRPTSETFMNRNQVKGTAKDVAGKVQRKVGEATGNTRQQIKGAGKQIGGKVQKGAGDVENAADNANEGKV